MNIREPMNYQETLDKIHSFQKFGSRLGLERMAVLMDFLGNPQDDMKVIHVAGTNGKGSVCRFLASMLKENGYKVGLYTSPYLQRFTERIEFDGSEISKDDLIRCAAKVFPAVDQMLSEGYESPTEFELVTAIGFVYFSLKPMDILVLEVGLGGNGDSTNIIKSPLVSVITSISYDHMDVLGDTIVDIAREKAGIIKDGCPVAANVNDPDALKVIEEICDRRGCDFYDASKILPKEVIKSLDGYSFVADMADIPGLHPHVPSHIRLSMVGMHQVFNGICALTVIGILMNMGIIICDTEKLRMGIKKAYNKGRLEILKKDPWLVIDGAHNEGGIKALAQVINDHFVNSKLLLVIGILADKKVDSLIDEFSVIPGDIVATEPDNPRKLHSDKLCKAVESKGRRCVDIGDWEKAYDYILTEMHNYDGVIVSGSLYLIGKIRERFTNENKENIIDI